GSVPSRSPCWRFSGWYTTRSDTSARASRRAFCFGSCTMKGFTGRSGPVMRCPGAAPTGASGAGGAGAGAVDAGRAGGLAARAAGAGPAAGARAGGGGGDTGAGTAGVDAGGAGGGAGLGGAGAAAPVAGWTGNTLLRTAQRARTPPGGTLAGSTRYTVSHDGQVTFISRVPRSHRAPGRAGGRPRTPIPAA